MLCGILCCNHANRTAALVAWVPVALPVLLHVHRVLSCCLPCDHIKARTPLLSKLLGRRGPKRIPARRRGWVDAVDRRAAAVQERLEADLNGYKNNMIKESIRMGHHELVRAAGRDGAPPCGPAWRALLAALLRDALHVRAAGRACIRME